MSATILKTRFLTRPLVIPGDKAWPADLSGLYERLKQDLSVEIPAGLGSLVIGPTQPEDVNTIWWRLSPAGNFMGIFVYVKGVWQNVSPPIGTITWRKGRPDQFTTGTDGWWTCDGEDGTFDLKQYFLTSDNSPITGGSANKTFPAFWAQLSSLLTTYHDATDTPTFVGTTVAEAAAYALALHEKSDNLFEALYAFMHAADECGCNDDYDASKVIAFLVEYKGVQNA